MAAMHVTALVALVETPSTSEMHEPFLTPLTKSNKVADNFITLITSPIRYDKVDDSWSELGVKLPERRELFSAMFVENLC